LVEVGDCVSLVGWQIDGLRTHDYCLLRMMISQKFALCFLFGDGSMFGWI
jgi:hypothetical protein